MFKRNLQIHTNLTDESARFFLFGFDCCIHLFWMSSVECALASKMRERQSDMGVSSVCIDINRMRQRTVWNFPEFVIATRGVLVTKVFTSKVHTISKLKSKN